MRIAQVLGDSGQWGEVGPELLERGCGGRELALLQLSRAWTDAGHEVTNFVPREELLRATCGSFVPHLRAVDVLRSVQFDVVVAIELPELLLDPAIAEAQAGARCYAHYQVAHASELAIRSTVAWVERHGSVPFAWSALSPWHARFLRELGCVGEVEVFPNGIDPLEFEPSRSRAPGPVFHYASSPDRGLSHMLGIWPLVRKKLPSAELHVAYGVDRWLEFATPSHRKDGVDASDVRHLLASPGVHLDGQLGRKDLLGLLHRSTALLYPCDTRAPTETGCITVLEALAAGCHVVTTDCDCLRDEFEAVAYVLPLPVDHAEFAEAAVAAIGREEALEDGLAFVRQRSWDTIAEQWLRSAAIPA